MPEVVNTDTIGTLANEVILRVENRTTDLSRAYVWLRDALIEITSAFDLRNEFDTLEILGTPYNLTVNVQEYDETPLLPAGVPYNLSTLDILIWLDPPTNSVRWRLEHSHYQKADTFQPTNSVPTEWYRFGNTIGFNPIPDKAYQVRTRMLQPHPINDSNLSATAIIIQRDWNEILIWAAAMRGFMELLEFEKAEKIRVLLYGDPKHPDRPGLVEGRKKRREHEAWRTEEALRPIVKASCYGIR